MEVQNGFSLLDLPLAHPLARLVVIADKLHKFSKAKLYHELYMSVTLPAAAYSSIYSGIHIIGVIKSVPHMIVMKCKTTLRGILEEINVKQRRAQFIHLSYASGRENLII